MEKVCKLKNYTEFELSFDDGIRDIVIKLRENGIETFESCDGSEDHAFKEPTVLFNGEYSEGFRAFAIAVENDLPVFQLKRAYRVENSELIGPWWEMTFIPTKGK